MNLSERSIAIGILHDGTISLIDKTLDKLIIKVHIPYLAEMIGKEYEYFTYHFSNCYSCYFIQWNTKLRVDDTSEITELELEINESEPDGGNIKITCLCDKPGIEGGYLFINSDHLTIYDHENQELTFENMRIIASRYWNRL